MSDLVEAANHLGILARGVTGDYEDLLGQKPPVIVHVVMPNGLNHFLVVYKITGNWVLIGDPGRGNYRLARFEFEAIWKTRSAILVAPCKLIVEEEVPTLPAWLLNQITRHEVLLTQSLFLGIIYTSIGLFTAWSIHMLLDNFIPSSHYDGLTNIICLLGGMLTIRAFAAYFRQRFLVHVGRRLGMEVNQSFVAKLFHLPKSFFDSRKPGDILARMADTNRLQSLVLRLSTVSIVDSLVLVGSIIYLLFIDLKLACCTAILLAVYALVLNSRTRRIRDYQNSLFQKFSETECSYVDSLEGINEILNFGTSNSFAKRNIDKYSAYQDKIRDLGYYQSTLTLHSELITGYALVGILLWGSILVTKSTITIGQLVATYSVVSGLIPCVMRFVETKIAFQGADLAFQRMSDLDGGMATEPQRRVSFRMEKGLSIVNGEIGWRQRKILWKNVNMIIPKGFLTALVGGSGSGKTTLTEVLMRNYPLSQGYVKIDETSAEEETMSIVVEIL
jgi:ATP-binding cassette subfamily B protein